MKEVVIGIFKTVGLHVGRFDAERHRERRDYFRRRQVYRQFTAYTMIPKLAYLDNLALAEQASRAEGDVVECGVWKGGMIAGLAKTLGDGRRYWLFDSFEGMPAAGEKDGETARKWQANTQSPDYHNNCSAPRHFAEEAMKLTGVSNYTLVAGWFSETLAQAQVQKIALLRLDGDWYDSTMECLEALYPKVVQGGIIIIDDYHMWPGCTRAVHDYLSRHQLTDRISQTKHGVAYIVKGHTLNPFI